MVKQFLIFKEIFIYVFRRPTCAIKGNVCVTIFSVSHADMDVDKDAFLEASKDIPR